MVIKKIEIKNFRSFKDTNVELGKFNVVIGANASGKSNFVQIFKFLRDIVNFGLDNAISMQGGVEYLRNVKIGASENFSLKVTLDTEFGLLRERGKISIKIYESTYEFALKFKKKGTRFKITKDVLTQKCKFVRVKKQRGKIKEVKEVGQGEIKFFRSNGKVKLDLYKSLEDIPIEEDDIYPPFLREEKLQASELLIEKPFTPPIFEVFRTFRDVSIYYIDPKLPKKATPITGKIELEEDGSNLPIILKNIIEKKEMKRMLLNLVRDLLPFINDLSIEKVADKSLLFKLRETYFDDYLPASLSSDGTINIIALIVALYFEKKPLIIIEEPERNIHPYLISKVLDMMKDASQKKQIITTTHNPEIVRFAGLENILLVHRDEDGFSTISRPADREEVRIFLQNEIGIDELYVQNLL